MICLLHINTALGRAMVAISRDNERLAYRENAVQKDHSSFLQPAIRDLLNDTGMSLKDMDAVTVINGPGSYTGLRVGLSAAKGICFSLQKPMINLSTLDWLAMPFKGTDETYICPLIDARRMEVFTATYDRNLNYITSPEALILGEQSFGEILDKGGVIFTGDGADKLPGIITGHPNARVWDNRSSVNEQILMGEMAYNRAEFADIAYCEPFYLKAFYTPETDKKR